MPINVVRPVFAVAVALSMSGCYVTRQAWHHADLYLSRRPVGEVLADPVTPDPIKSKLSLVNAVVEYAEKEGLNTEDSYRSYIALDGPGVSYLVQAAEPDQLEFKTWWFPIVGSVPYLGFFEKKERDEEAAILRTKGYDVTTGVAAAFSSLGYFEDPIYTSMLKNDDASLIHLMFHELTHRTFWSKGSANFNENLAEFIGLHLTRKFLTKHGLESEMDAFVAKRRDRDLFRAWLKELRQELTQLYKSKKPREEILKEKKVIFAKFSRDKLPKFETGYFGFVARQKWNNASVLAAALYTPDTTRFENAYNCFGETKPVSAFLDALKLAEDKYDDAFRALDSLCAK